MQYLDLLESAIKTGNSSSLADSIRSSGILKKRERYRKKDGSYGDRKVVKNAHTMMAEGEFNRFYLRAIALYAVENNCEIIAYRAKPVSRPRAESEALIGNCLNPDFLLNDLRVNIGQKPWSKMPGGPNSGISGYLKC